jgi:hypothetical protein
MSIKSFIARQYAAYIVRKTRNWSANPIRSQERVFRSLLHTLKYTEFGKDHQVHGKETYEEFRQKVPVRDYEGNKAYFDRVVLGEPNVLWKEIPLYLAKTSGTTSGTKYIPITKESISNHINAARDAILHYIHEKQNASLLNGKLIFLSGSPELDRKSGILTGRLSGISNHHVPSYLRSNQMPSYETNCIEDWEKKVRTIAEETLHEDMTLISGIPPWVQMYFDVLQEMTGKKEGELFPNFNLFVFGGVNFVRYRK